MVLNDSDDVVALFILHPWNQKDSKYTHIISYCTERGVSCACMVIGLPLPPALATLSPCVQRQNFSINDMVSLCLDPLTNFQGKGR